MIADVHRNAAEETSSTDNHAFVEIGGVRTASKQAQPVSWHDIAPDQPARAARGTVPDIDPLRGKPGAPGDILLGSWSYGLDVAGRICGLAQIGAQDRRIWAAVKADCPAGANLPLRPVVGARRAAGQDVNISPGCEAIIDACFAIGVPLAETACRLRTHRNGGVFARTMLDQER